MNSNYDESNEWIDDGVKEVVGFDSIEEEKEYLEGVIEDATTKLEELNEQDFEELSDDEIESTEGGAGVRVVYVNKTVSRSRVHTGDAWTYYRYGPGNTVRSFRWIRNDHNAAKYCSNASIFGKSNCVTISTFYAGGSKHQLSFYVYNRRGNILRRVIMTLIIR